MDNVSRQVRSRTMAAVKSTGNRSTERVLRAHLVRGGFRGWRLHAKDVAGLSRLRVRRAARGGVRRRLLLARLPVVPSAAELEPGVLDEEGGAQQGARPAELAAAAAETDGRCCGFGSTS